MTAMIPYGRQDSTVADIQAVVDSPCPVTLDQYQLAAEFEKEVIWV